MISTIITAIVSFTSTNIDDIFVLMLFFSQTNNVMKRWHIVLGQYFGIGALIAISIIGALGVSIIPHEYVGLLGLVPVYLGIKTYIDYKKGCKKYNDINDENNKSEEKEETTDTQVISIFPFVNLSILKVFSVTFANGGDNVGIYIPIFASMSLSDIWVTVIIFMILIALWCIIGIKLAEHPFIRINIEKYKYVFVPIVFIAMGIFILMESGTVSFIYKIYFG